MSVKSILLVDDDESTNFINSIFIKKLDIDVHVYKTLNGAEALEVINTSNTKNGFFPCLIILDINMPVMSGWSFLEHFKNLPQPIKEQCFVVMTTVSEDEKDIIRASKNEDVKKFYQKPMSDEKFSQLISEYFF